MRNMHMPAQNECDTHRRTHIDPEVGVRNPYRGSARNSREQRGKQERGAPGISLGYMFMGNGAKGDKKPSVATHDIDS